MFLGALALSFLALPASLPVSDPWQLRHGYLSSAVIEVDPGTLDPEPLAQVLATLSGRFERTGQRLALETRPSGPRVLLRSGSAFPASFESSLGRLGFAWNSAEPGVFLFHGRRFERAEDGFAATFEDPERAGLPTTIWFANSEVALTGYLTALEPQSRPGFSAFRGGELELSGALSPSGTMLTADMIDRRKAWSARFERDARLSLRGFNCRVPESFEGERALRYLDVLAEARARALTWADASGQAAESPVGAIGETAVVVHGHVEEMLSLIGEADLSLVNPVTGMVHVLLAEGIPDDGGAAVAESAVRRLLGPPSAPWLGPAVGVSGADSWWGRNLEPFCARLVSAGVVPSLTELVVTPNSGFLSPHVRKPLLGLFFQHLAREHDEAFLRDLWTGAVQLDLAAEEPAWSALLSSLGAKRKARPLQPGTPPGSWRAGCVLVPGEVGYGSRLVETSLDDLVARGASAVNLRAFTFRDALEPSVPGRLHRPSVSAREGDLVLASAAAAARSRGLEVGLDLHVLVNSEGGLSADLSLPNATQIEGFFADYAPLLVHEALVAELIGARRFSVGTGLSNTTIPSKVAGLEPLMEQGWLQLIATARGLFDQQVIYTAASFREASLLTFASALDVLAIELFPSLEAGAEGEGFGPGQAPDPTRLAGRLTGELVNAAELAEERGVGLLISGLGFASTREAWLRTDLPRGATSPETQELLYRALQVAVTRVERRFPGRLVGLLVWNWSSYPAAGGLADRGYSPQGKPAAELLPGLLRSPRQE